MQPNEYEIMAQAERTHPWFLNRRRLVRGLLRRFAPRRSRLRVLDAGSGTGMNLDDYARFGWSVGIELNRHAAAMSCQSGARRIVVGDLCRMPFPNGGFDLVISTDVIEHIADDLAALGELRRVLAPGGRIVLTTPAYSWAYAAHDRFLHHVRRYDADRLRVTFRRAGLRVLHLSRYNVLLTAPVLIRRLWRERHRGPGDQPDGSDVSRPVPRLLASLLDVLLHLEASLAERLNFGVGLTHAVVLGRR
jgi:SAM-dependent methyltransferase